MQTVDFVVIGGALSGASTAFHLKRQAPDASIVLIERDPTFRTAATALSASGIRQQFSLAENIRLSQRTLQMLMEYSVQSGYETNFGLRENGYLVMASPAGLPALSQSHAVQRTCGAATLLLDPAALEARFDWLATDGLGGATFGPSGEGWFDAMALLGFFRSALKAMPGVSLVSGTVTGITARNGRISSVCLDANKDIAPGEVVIASGPASGAVARIAGAGLTVEPRKRTVFSVRSPFHDPAMPLTVEPGGVWVRPEGAGYICGWSPPDDDDHTAAPDDFEPDWHLFENHIWAVLAARIPAFEELKVSGAWAGHYDFNPFDHNALIGRLPGFENLACITGFSGHGVQQAPAAGEALAAHLLGDPEPMPGFSRFSPGRIARGEPFRELAII